MSFFLPKFALRTKYHQAYENKTTHHNPMLPVRITSRLRRGEYKHDGSDNVAGVIHNQLRKAVCLSS